MGDLASNSLPWCPLNFEVFNEDHSSSYMGSNEQSFSADFDIDMSTGYLQDALNDQLHDRSKRRRLFFYSEEHSDLNDNSSFNWDLHGNLNCLGKLTEHDVFAEPEKGKSEVNSLREIKIQEDEISCFEDALFSSPDSYKENSVDSTNFSVSILNSGNEEKKSKKVYPFSVIKPGGLNDGETTLTEINEKILKTPARRVKHPVGEYACKPSVLSVNGGPGLSGKAVVSLTRIHTLGRGTITIIRTKG